MTNPMRKRWALIDVDLRTGTPHVRRSYWLRSSAERTKRLADAWTKWDDYLLTVERLPYGARS